MSKGRANSENSWPGPHDVAYYNFRTDEWETPLNHGEDIYIYPVYADETHSVAATHGDPSGYPSAIVKGTLVFLDREAGAVTTIFRYPPISEGSIFTGFHLNNITILDGQIYFDDFTVYSFDGSGGSDTDSTLYAYDIESGALRVVREHAMNPIVYKDEVWFFTPDKDGSYTLLQSESGGQPLKNHHEIGALASSQGRLFTTRGMGEDAALGTSLTGVFEWGGGTAIAESRKGNVIYGLQGNQDFLVWQTSMPNQPPCVYDIAEDTLYEFTDYERCEYTFYLGGRAGLIHIREIDASGAETGNEVYRLFQKP
ncbi:MAG: hypothetical protein FWG93_00580 [Oscillospiraceae bacterium]|nr:hypothetical protein [Oscillospiraceae bacterium]